MSSAETFDVPESRKAKADPPEVRKRKPPVAASALEHRHLRDDEFWRSLPAFDVDRETFLDYKWQMRNSLYGERNLLKTLEGAAPEEFIEEAQRGFHQVPMAVRVTPYLLSLIDWEDPWSDPIRRQFLPLAGELQPDHPMLTLDSLHEQADAPVEGLTHRYPDKALFLALDTCPVYCRFCTRSYAIGVDTDTVEKVSLKVSPDRWEKAFDYIETRPELEDIVISGGDTWNLAGKHIKTLGERLLNIPHIRRIRFATKGPAVMPMKVLSDERWTDALTAVHELGLKLHKHVCVHTHFNHPDEITAITRESMNVLFERGITIRNQSVLQRGVNDDRETAVRLTKRLGEVNVHPYYVYQHDMVQGVEDLRTPVQAGLDLEKWVRGTTAGFNCPLYIVDLPGGGGKRNIHSFEYYDRVRGISVYQAPSVKGDEYFMYFDPLHSLDEEVQEDWMDPAKQKTMLDTALEAARYSSRS